ncbi:MAG: hypothetical protein ACOC4G_02530 [Bacillota bacterium]
MDTEGLLFLNHLLQENIVFYYFLGALLIIIKTPPLKKSYRTGLIFSSGLLATGLLGWLLNPVFSESFTYLVPGFYFFNALLGLAIIKKLGLLNDYWLGIPEYILALGPLVGLQMIAERLGQNNGFDLVIIIAGVSGFYLAFLTIAAIKEQLQLSEAKNELFKSEYTLLIVMAIFSLLLMGFDLM